MSKLLINEPPLQVLPTLAKIIGLNKAIFLQQIHYWLTIPKIGTTDDQGVKWVRNSIPEWRKDNFPFWSEKTVKRILDSLVDDGLIKRNDRLNKFRQDRTRWYTVDYELLGDIEARGQLVTPPKQGDNLSPPKGQPVTPQKDNLSPTLPETTPETTPEISPPGEESPSGPDLTNTPQRDPLQEWQDDVIASIVRHTDQEMLASTGVSMKGPPLMVGDTLVDREIISQILELRQEDWSFKQISEKLSIPVELINDIFIKHRFYPDTEIAPTRHEAEAMFGSNTHTVMGDLWEDAAEGKVEIATAYGEASIPEKTACLIYRCSLDNSSVEQIAKKVSLPVDLVNDIIRESRYPPPTDFDFHASLGPPTAPDSADILTELVEHDSPDSTPQEFQSEPTIRIGDTLVDAKIINQLYAFRQEKMSLKQMAAEVSLPIDLISDIFMRNIFYPPLDKLSEERPDSALQDFQDRTPVSPSGPSSNSNLAFGDTLVSEETSDPDPDLTDILTELAEDEALAGDDFADITAPRIDAKLLSEADAAHLRTLGKFSGSALPGIYDIIQEIKAVWDIFNPTEELAIALFLEAIRTKRSAFAIPKNQGIRNDWIKSVRGHLQDYPVDDLGDLYQRAITKLDQAGMTFSRPGSLTKTLPDVLDEPTVKTIVDKDGGFYI